MKEKIDVVLSLGEIFDENKEISNYLTKITSSFYKNMIISNTIRFPFYIWGITINNVTHISYSISCKRFDINLFKKLSENIEIIDDDDFK